MAYVREDIKFVLTNRGKEEAYKHGLSKIFKYFTVSDDGFMYTLDVKPTDLTDVNGSHTTSTNIISGNNNNIQK